MNKGRFLVLEGPDGSGKSTQAAHLAAAIRASGRPLEHLRDPGGTVLGDGIRRLLLEGGAIDRTAETFLFLASRSQLVAERIRPALAAGRVVLCERFTMSTVVYQGRAADPPLEGATLEAFRGVVAASSLGLEPDLVVVLDVDPATGLRRKAGPAGLDRIERKGEAYQALVRAGYLAEAALEPRAILVPAGTEEATRGRVLAAAEEALARR